MPRLARRNYPRMLTKTVRRRACRAEDNAFSTIALEICVLARLIRAVAYFVNPQTPDKQGAI